MHRSFVEFARAGKVGFELRAIEIHVLDMRGKAHLEPGGIACGGRIDRRAGQRQTKPPTATVADATRAVSAGNLRFEASRTRRRPVRRSSHSIDQRLRRVSAAIGR